METVPDPAIARHSIAQQHELAIGLRGDKHAMTRLLKSQLPDSGACSATLWLWLHGDCHSQIMFAEVIITLPTCT